MPHPLSVACSIRAMLHKPAEQGFELQYLWMCVSWLLENSEASKLTVRPFSLRVYINETSLLKHSILNLCNGMPMYNNSK